MSTNTATSPSDIQLNVYDSGIVCNNASQMLAAQHFLSNNIDASSVFQNTENNFLASSGNPLLQSAYSNVACHNMYQMLNNGMCAIPNVMQPNQYENNNMIDSGICSLQNNPCIPPYSYSPGSAAYFATNPLIQALNGQTMVNMSSHMANCACNSCMINRNATNAYLSMCQNQIAALNTWNTMQLEAASHFSINNASSPMSTQQAQILNHNKGGAIFSSSPKRPLENNGKPIGAHTTTPVFSNHQQPDCDSHENSDLGGVGGGTNTATTFENKNIINYQSTASLINQQQLKKKPTGVSKNILYKTVQCNDFKTTGSCPRGNNCQFAHGMEEVHDPRNHSLYKTAFCNDFKEANYCPRGNNCFHVHDPNEMRQKNNGHRLSFSLNKRTINNNRIINLSKVNACEKDSPISGRLSPSSVAQIINMQPSSSKMLCSENVKKETEEIWNILNLSNNKNKGTFK